MTEQELRAIRMWAVESALGKQGLEQTDCEEHHSISIQNVIKDARALVTFVTEPGPRR